LPLSKLQFQPGLVKDATDYANEGGWFSADKVRFRQGFPEKIGGWQKFSSRSFLGVCRRLISWTDLTGRRNIGVGTNIKYYVNQGGRYFDITPIRETTAAGDATFSVVDGSSTITVTEVGHQALAQDFVIFENATDLGGNITADVLNQEYQITEVIDSNTYTIEAREPGTTIQSITVDGQLDPTPVTADASDTGNGGTATVATYLLNRTLDTTVLGTGWGAGPWSRKTWGSEADIPITASQIALWSHDTFGEDLLMNQRGGPIYLWDTSEGTGSRAVELADLPGASDPPAQVNQVMVSDQDRHVIAFGATPQSGSEFDPMLIRFSDQENPAEWTAAATNTAGDLVLGSGISSECDRYVVYNYQQNIWYTGTLRRDAWLDRASKNKPVAAGGGGYLYFHEVGSDDGSTNPPSPLEAFIESSPIDIGDGNEFSFITRILPDVDFRQSSSSSPEVTMTLDAYNYPGQGVRSTDDGNVVRSASAPVDIYTDKLDVRLRGRAFSLRIESDSLGTTWRSGANRVDIKPDGRR